MTNHTLTCAGKPKYDRRASCWADVAWVILPKGSTWVSAACRHHIHQVLKHATADIHRATIFTVEDYYRIPSTVSSNERDRRTEALEEWLELLRPVVQDSAKAIQAADAIKILKAHGHRNMAIPGLAEAAEVLDMLFREGVLKRSGISNEACASHPGNFWYYAAGQPPPWSVMP